MKILKQVRNITEMCGVLVLESRKTSVEDMRYFASLLWNGTFKYIEHVYNVETYVSSCQMVLELC